MTLRPVDSSAAHVALHQSARSRGYKLSREGTDPRSLQGGVWVVLARCVSVIARCVCVFLSEVCVFIIPKCGHSSPFIVFKGRARVTFVVKM
jgi:hypothetical protein